MTCWGVVQGSYCFTDLFVIRDGYEATVQNHTCSKPGGAWMVRLSSKLSIANSVTTSMTMLTQESEWEGQHCSSSPSAGHPHCTAIRGGPKFVSILTPFVLLVKAT